MYYLQKNAALLNNYHATAQLREQVLQTIADATAGLTFEPEEHRYFLGNKELSSVSSIVEYFGPFDKVKVATACSNNPKHPLYGKPVEEIIAIWEENGRVAANEGTKIHAFGEACYLWMTGQENLIEDEYMDRITPDGLLAIEQKEVSLAKWWAQHDWNRFVPIAKETRIVNPLLSYAGTMDLLLYDMYNMAFVLDDYKTNKDLFRWFGEYCLPPLSVLKNNDIGHYTIQQTLYTIVLRNYGLPVIDNSLIWLKENEYQQHSLPMKYDKIIHYAVQNLQNQSVNQIQS